MVQDRKFQNNYLIHYFIIAFTITWIFFLPRVLSDNGFVTMPKFILGLSFLAPFGPAIAAFGLSYKLGGWKEIKSFWKRGWDFSFEKKWLAVVFFLPAIMTGLTILTIYLLGSEILWEYQPLPLVMAAPIFILIFLTQALPEEYGWRGFALDRLQSRWNALLASLVLGFLWGLWHLPLHFMVGTTQEVIPIFEFILKQMVGAIFYTWIYNNTNRNLFLMFLLHAVWNLLGGLVPFWVTSTGRWVNFGIEVLFAAIIVAAFGAKRLVRKDLINKEVS